MTPKEKAEKLYRDAYMRWCYELSHDKNYLTAKDIAIYICNEILNNNTKLTDENNSYWLEVKREIKKL